MPENATKTAVYIIGDRGDKDAARLASLMMERKGIESGEPFHLSEKATIHLAFENNPALVIFDVHFRTTEEHIEAAQLVAKLPEGVPVALVTNMPGDLRHNIQKNEQIPDAIKARLQVFGKSTIVMGEFADLTDCVAQAAECAEPVHAI